MSEPNDKHGLSGGPRQPQHGLGPPSGRKPKEGHGGWGSPATAGGRFGHFAKYTKPKIGANYQCSVPAWEDPAKKQAADAEGEASSASNATAEVAGRATRRRGTR